jgi:hypothetical protein
MAAMLDGLRGITVSVGYAPLLRLTLPRNMAHLAECWVVTSPEDEHTQYVACSVPGVQVHVTDAFTRHQARMNKGLALEECFDQMGRHGWCLIHDADILFPEAMPLDDLQPDRLYGCRRRILEDPAKWHPCLNWRSCPVSSDNAPIGYWQLFHADAIKDKWPWYGVNFPHAGGGDAEFLSHWTADKRTVLPFDVLHLGKTDRHWFGLDQTGIDMMAAYVYRMCWRGAMRKHDPKAVERVGELPDRIEVPGYPMSDFMMPFERRVKQARNA